MDGKMNMKFSTSVLQTGGLVESLQTDDLRPAMGTILAIQRDKTGNSTLDAYLVQVGENLIGVYLASQLVYIESKAQDEVFEQLVP